MGFGKMDMVTTQKYTAIEDLRVNAPFGACLTALHLYVQNIPKHPNFINFSWILDKGDTFISVRIPSQFFRHHV